MFISRFLQVVILAYLFNLLIVACSPNSSGCTNTSSSSSITRCIQLHLDCNNNNVEILHRRVRANHGKGRLAKDEAYSWLVVDSVDQKVQEHNVSLVTIRGNLSGMYLCFNKKIKLITRHSYHKSCEFREIYESKYTKFESELYRGCYMAFNKRNGKPFKNRHCLPRKNANGKDGDKAGHKLRHQHSAYICNNFTKISFYGLMHTDSNNYNEKG